MKVLLIVTQLEVGGAQTASRTLKQELINAGLTAELAFLYEKNSSAYSDRDYVTLFKRKPRSVSDYMRIFVNMYRFWKSYKPDVILARTHYSVAFMILGKLMRLPGAGVAVQANVSNYGPLIARIIDWIGGTLGISRKIVMVSQSTADTFSAYPANYRSRICVIPNGVKIPVTKIDQAVARTKLGLEPGGFWIGSAGRLAEQKNHRFLIELAAKIPDINIVIAGEGDLHDTLIRKAIEMGVDKRIHFLGAVDNSEMPNFYSALDVFALPSFHEGRSNALLEALAFSVPVIVNDTPTVADVIAGANSVAGRALPLNIETWAQELRRIKDDVAYREKLCQGARNLAIEFGVEQMTRSYIDIMRAAQ